MSARPVLLERHGPIAHIVLNRPEKLNAINGECLHLLKEYVREIDSDHAVRAVIVRGVGRAFCTGADLDFVRGRLESRSAFAAFLDDWHATFDIVAASQKPTVAAVHGFALAGGLELVLACDFAVVANGARLGDQHAQLGLFPGGGGTQRLPRLIGIRRAKWLLLSGESLSPSDALAWGLANAAVPDDEVLDSAMQMASTLARRSDSANRLIKRAVDEGIEQELRGGLAVERSLAVEHMLGEDARRGLAAFRSGSSPVFHKDESDAACDD